MEDGTEYQTDSDEDNESRSGTSKISRQSTNSQAASSMQNDSAFIHSINSEKSAISCNSQAPDEWSEFQHSANASENLSENRSVNMANESFNESYARSGTSGMYSQMMDGDESVMSRGSRRIGRRDSNASDISGMSGISAMSKSGYGYNVDDSVYTHIEGEDSKFDNFDYEQSDVSGMSRVTKKSRRRKGGDESVMSDVSGISRSMADDVSYVSGVSGLSSIGDESRADDSYLSGLSDVSFKSRGHRSVKGDKKSVRGNDSNYSDASFMSKDMRSIKDDKSFVSQADNSMISGNLSDMSFVSRDMRSIKDDKSFASQMSNSMYSQGNESNLSDASFQSRDMRSIRDDKSYANSAAGSMISNASNRSHLLKNEFGASSFQNSAMGSQDDLSAISSKSNKSSKTNKSKKASKSPSKINPNQREDANNSFISGNRSEFGNSIFENTYQESNASGITSKSFQNSEMPSEYGSDEKSNISQQSTALRSAIDENQSNISDNKSIRSGMSSNSRVKGVHRSKVGQGSKSVLSNVSIDPKSTKSNISAKSGNLQMEFDDESFQNSMYSGTRSEFAPDDAKSIGLRSEFAEKSYQDSIFSKDASAYGSSISPSMMDDDNKSISSNRSGRSTNSSAGMRSAISGQSFQNSIFSANNSAYDNSLSPSAVGDDSILSTQTNMSDMNNSILSNTSNKSNRSTLSTRSSKKRKEKFNNDKLKELNDKIESRRTKNKLKTDESDSSLSIDFSGEDIAEKSDFSTFSGVSGMSGMSVTTYDSAVYGVLENELNELKGMESIVSDASMNLGKKYTRKLDALNKMNKKEDVKAEQDKIDAEKEKEVAKIEKEKKEEEKKEKDKKEKDKKEKDKKDKKEKVKKEKPKK